MHRMAVETGGEVTKNTNDFTRAYDRARNDLSCNYALGFEPSSFREDRPLRVRVHLRPRGLRAHHAESMVRRSEREKASRLFQGAYFSPAVFDTGRVLAHIFPVRPLSSRRWDSMLAIQFPVPVEPGVEPTPKDFGAVLVSASGTIVAHRSNDVFLPDAGSGASGTTAAVNYRKSVRLKPGEYDLRVVMKDRGEDTPHSAQVRIQVPRLPKGELVLIDPVLGRPAGANATRIDAGKKKRPGPGEEEGDALSFQPVIDRRIEDAPYLVVYSSVCFLGKDEKKLNEETTIVRRLLRKDGSLVGELDPVALDFSGGGLTDEDTADFGKGENKNVKCQRLVDGIPPLPPGEYVFEESLRPLPEDSAYALKTVPFSLLAKTETEPVSAP